MWNRILEDALEKIDEHRKTNGGDWSSLDSDVQCFCLKICETLREGSEKASM